MPHCHGARRAKLVAIRVIVNGRVARNSASTSSMTLSCSSHLQALGTALLAPSQSAGSLAILEAIICNHCRLVCDGLCVCHTLLSLNNGCIKRVICIPRDVINLHARRWRSGKAPMAAQTKQLCLHQPSSCPCSWAFDESHSATVVAVLRNSSAILQ